MMTLTTTQKIVSEYRIAQGRQDNGKSKPLPYRAFAEKLSEITPVSYGAVHHWETGVMVPLTETLLVLYIRSKDWRKEFAADCLAAQIPDWLPEGAIGKRVLGQQADSPTPARKAAR